MKWIITFLGSSIGRKLIMSLTGLFLITFLPVHLIGNIALLFGDDGASFNAYADFMTSFLPIKLISFGLYFFIILHAVQGLVIYFGNKKAKSTKTSISTNANSSWASKNMALLGILILAFLCIHMGDFWLKMKTGGLDTVMIAGQEHGVADLYSRVNVAFDQWWIVLIYVLGMIALAFHLMHGFQSAFQTLGINHKKYTPIINFLGIGYSIIIPFGFALIPIIMYFT